MKPKWSSLLMNSMYKFCWKFFWKNGSFLESWFPALLKLHWSPCALSANIRTTCAQPRLSPLVIACLVYHRKRGEVWADQLVCMSQPRTSVFICRPWASTLRKCLGPASNRYRTMSVTRFHETLSFIPCISFMIVNVIIVINWMRVLQTLWLAY